ncbi:MAG TPA: sigma-70 family RNA polymerase sigma factor [Solirubrobacteraceae bacterium]|jgi:RNA polymerase sigma factor (sigma-70 family)
MESQLASDAPASARVVSPPLGRLDDERLARLVGAGSDTAFSLLYERYHQQLYRYCRSILRDETDAQDALQSALAGSLAALQRGQRNAPVRPWLFRIAHNEAISLLRRRPAQPELSESEQSAVGSAEDQAQTRASLAQLVADLQDLPERQRATLVMHELSGLSHAEIAVALQTTPRASKQAIFEARQALAELAEGRAMTCEKVQRAISDGDGRALRGRRLRAHMRDCATCTAFAAEIPARRTQLQMLAPPLAPIAASAVLAQLTHSGGAHGALAAGAAHGGGGALGSVAATSAGKTIGGALAVKALAGAAIVATVAAGAATVLPRQAHRARPGRAAARHSPSDASPASGSRSAQPTRHSPRASGHAAAGARGQTRKHPSASKAGRGLDQGVGHRTNTLPAARGGGRQRAASSPRSSARARTRRGARVRAPGSSGGATHAVRPPPRGGATPTPSSRPVERPPHAEGVAADSPAVGRQSSTAISAAGATEPVSR